MAARVNVRSTSSDAAATGSAAWGFLVSFGIPLIRNYILLPTLDWLERQGRDPEALFDSSRLGFFDGTRPFGVSPLFPISDLLVQLMEDEGQDIACRIIGDKGFVLLAPLRHTALSAPNLREALRRLVVVMPRHCSHEALRLEPVPGGLRVHDTWLCRWSGRHQHVVSQYFSSLARSLVACTGAEPPWFTSVQLPPHPEHGVAHLVRHFGPDIRPSSAPSAALTIPDRVLDMPFRVPAGAAPTADDDWTHLTGNMDMSTSARIVIAAMLRHRTPTIDDLARAGRVSARTLQRRLQQEGTSFSEVLDALRRDHALTALRESRAHAGQIASDLGYAQQSTLSRSVRRWTGQRPRDLRETYGAESVEPGSGD